MAEPVSVRREEEKMVREHRENGDLYTCMTNSNTLEMSINAKPLYWYSIKNPFVYFSPTRKCTEGCLHVDAWSILAGGLCVLAQLERKQMLSLLVVLFRWILKYAHCISPWVAYWHIGTVAMRDNPNVYTPLIYVYLFCLAPFITVSLATRGTQPVNQSWDNHSSMDFTVNCRRHPNILA